MNFDDLINQVKQFIGNKGSLVQGPARPPINQEALAQLLQDEPVYDDRGQATVGGGLATDPSQLAYTSSDFYRGLQGYTANDRTLKPVPDVIPRGYVEKKYEDGSSEFQGPTRDIFAEPNAPWRRPARAKFY